MAIIVTFITIYLLVQFHVMINKYELEKKNSSLKEIQKEKS